VYINWTPFIKEQSDPVFGALFLVSVKIELNRLCQVAPDLVAMPSIYIKLSAAEHRTCEHSFVI